MSDSLAPSDIVAKLIDIGAAKSQNAVPDLLIHGSAATVAHHSAMSLEKPLSKRLL
jgi:hypothetical protein